MPEIDTEGIIDGLADERLEWVEAVDICSWSINPSCPLVNLVSLLLVF